jgi:hypothetical protein
MDKSAHPIIPGAVKPDLIVHAPGTMSENLVAIEVKVASGSPSGFLKDLGTLTLMRTLGRYHHAILLAFGESGRMDLRRRLRAEDIDPFGRPINRSLVELYWHDAPGNEPTMLRW